MNETERKIVRVLEYWNFMNKEPRCRDIARKLYYSDNNIKYHLNKLIDKGVVIRKGKRYTLAIEYPKD